MRGVILYGPPASGKDTITRALHSQDARYVLFPRIKCGGGKTSGYRMVSSDKLAELRECGDVIWENERYGSTYAVDRPGLTDYLARTTPVLHLGQVEAIKKVTLAIPGARWLVVYLTISREVAGVRIAARRDGDQDARMEAWDATMPLINADLSIDTGLVLPEDAACRIRAL